ncbi:hypothetical protein HAX54_026265, partial [Datura stramonium]|nr:hypothetical protein [Datura stramonium]
KTKSSVEESKSKREIGWCSAGGGWSFAGWLSARRGRRGLLFTWTVFRRLADRRRERKREGRLPEIMEVVSRQWFGMEIEEGKWYFSDQQQLETEGLAGIGEIWERVKDANDAGELVLPEKMRQRGRKSGSLPEKRRCG